MSCAALLLGLQLNACTPAVKALETCSAPEVAEMSRADATTFGTTTGDQRMDSRKAISNFNRASDALFRCETIRRRAESLCGDDPDYASAAQVNARNAVNLDYWMKRLLNQVRQQTNNQPAGRVLNCIPSFIDGINHWDCRLLDRQAPRARIVSSADLPLTVGVSRECTFTVMPDGRLLTANHCGADDLKSGMIYRYYSWTPVTARFSGALPVDARALFTGQPFEDLSVWTADNVVHGLPFYILVRDRQRAQGCAVLNDMYFVCSPEAFAELHRRDVHLIGFPYSRYATRDRAETVVLADGKLLFDPDPNRLLIHAAMGQGGSGGPAYLDAGQTLGGVKLDRPLYLGPLSGFSPPRPIPPRPQVRNGGLLESQLAEASGKMNVDINYGDTLAIVGILDEARLRGVLPPMKVLTGSNAH